MLVGTHQIGRARRGVEALGELAFIIPQVIADDGKRDAIDRCGLAIRGPAILYMDDGEFAAQIVQKVGRRAVGAPSLVVPANTAASGVDSGVS